MAAPAASRPSCGGYGPAHSRDPDAVLYWHLDDDYAARTELRHQLAIDLSPGEHRVTVVDAEGRRLTRSFQVLSRGGRAQEGA